MNKITRLATVMVLAIACAPAMAAEDEEDGKFPNSIEEKLGAGFANTTTGWVEIVKTPIAVSKKDGIGMGLTLGVAQGFINMMGRTLWGLFDVVTFILPTKPMIEPHVIWQDFDQETRYKNRFETFKE